MYWIYFTCAECFDQRIDNGRIGRFLMNAMFCSGGYPWTVVRHSRRAEYLAALETASTQHDIRPFAAFIQEEMDAPQEGS